MKKSLLLTLLAVATASVSFAAEEAKECTSLSATVTAEVTASPSDVLAIVNAQIPVGPAMASINNAGDITVAAQAFASVCEPTLSTTPAQRSRASGMPAVDLMG